ncbi:CocE/NonD family hydrolase [Pseudonocardia xishanensis]|uniref:CocE/NonD family hydrolase n=2 Tax=Pseudonocardia xishanensis TaxID=630995 RepID=A0ABP8RQS0_9PSEU
MTSDIPPAGMTIDWDVPITMDDGVVLRADVFRPSEPGAYPVVLSHGPYGKGLAFQEGYASAWQQMIDAYPEVAEGTSNRYQVWELVDPEKWVPDGYVCVRIDSRGAGRSEGVLDILSAREAADLCDCVEWAGTRDWSNGRVGILGISYFAMAQWQAASLRPPHLAAICVWEGAADFYRDAYRHGGIGSDFGLGPWFPNQIAAVQHGVGKRGPVSPVTGEYVAGPETLDDDTLAANRVELAEQVLAHRLDDEYYRSRRADFAAIDVPVLSSGNWGGAGLHLRGNIEGFLAAGSSRKWLEMHGGTHFSPFYTDEGVALQKRFLGHFLKGEETGWEQQPPIELKVRHPGERFVSRAETQWPLTGTEWRRYHLDPNGRTLSPEPAGGPSIEYRTTGPGVTFLTAAFSEETEVTGPLAARLHLSSATTDADVFLAVRLFDPAGVETTFIGTNDPQVPLTLGWLRASHRKLDPERSLPYRPYHRHDESQPLVPDEIVELDVEIWPTCIVIPRGYRLGLTVLGRDYGNAPHYVPHSGTALTGVSPFSHTHPADRPSAVFDTTNTLHFALDRPSYLLVPVIPRREGTPRLDWFAHLRGTDDRRAPGGDDAGRP